MSYRDFRKLNEDRPGFLKLVEGENRIRLVSEAVPFVADWGTRYVAYAIDRSDNKIKPFTFGPQIGGQIGALAVSTEYGFEELPPYDLIIIRVGSGKETEYTVNGARSNSELTEDEKAAIAKQGDINKVADSLTKKARARQSEEVDIPVHDDREPTADSDLPF